VLWNTRDGTKTRGTGRPREGGAAPLATFSPDGSLLASGSRFATHGGYVSETTQHMIKLWDALTGQCLSTLEGTARG